LSQIDCLAAAGLAAAGLAEAGLAEASPYNIKITFSDQING